MSELNLENAIFKNAIPQQREALQPQRMRSTFEGRDVGSRGYGLFFHNWSFYDPYPLYFSRSPIHLNESKASFNTAPILSAIRMHLNTICDTRQYQYQYSLTGDFSAAAGYVARRKSLTEQYASSMENF